MASIIHNNGELQMETSAAMMEAVREAQAEILIAIRAATTANGTPCFAHPYEKTVTSGIKATAIKSASEIALLVKGGTHTAIASAIDDRIGSKEVNEVACGKTPAGSCCC